ncbi:MAG: transglycosylase domain-containing protein, partial [Gammaproteobacteria bacterium]|nr:transglycosylase domain-containing protein [Gammaproteobacteria bacterium]
QWRFPHTTTVATKFKQALIQYEDKRFYSHPGIDPFALTRAIYLNTTQSRVVSGASTLSMQVIRLARKNPQRSYLEKLLEMILALRLELRFNKDEILSLYANHAPFGGNVVGVETAAWRYFGRSTAQLSWAESATLAVLPNNPSMIHPGRNRNTLKNKRDALLSKLHNAKILDAIEFKIAKLEPLPEKPVSLPRIAPHLLNTLLSNEKQTLTKEQQNHRFKSTINKHTQQAVNKVIQQHSKALSLQGIYNAAAIVIDNDNFNVIAYVGNSNNKLVQQRGYAIDIIKRPRSTGSILKPFLFARMIQRGEILTKTLIADLPTQYSGYMPENFDHRYRG